MRITILSVFLVSLGLSSAGAQEPAPARQTVRYVTGTLEGSVTGTRDTTFYNGDRVVEKIDCTIKMTFRDDATMDYETGTYFYEYTYTKRTTTGGTLVHHIRVVAGGDTSNLESKLQIGITQYGRVWRAGWSKRVEVVGHHFEESWLTTRDGRKYGHKTLIDKNEAIYCEPRVIWRGANGRGPGLGLSGTGTWPDIKNKWATDQVTWDFTLLGRPD